MAAQSLSCPGDLVDDRREVTEGSAGVLDDVLDMGHCSRGRRSSCGDIASLSRRRPPRLKGCRPARQRARVDLLLPKRPTTAIRSPARIMRSTSASTSTLRPSWRCRVPRSSAESSGSLAVGCGAQLVSVSVVSTRRRMNGCRGASSTSALDPGYMLSLGLSRTRVRLAHALPNAAAPAIWQLARTPD